MQHAGTVGGLNGTADLHRNAHHLGDRHALPPVALRERGRTHLHDEVGTAVGGNTGLVHGEDGRVRAQLSHQVGFRLEHLPHLVVDNLAEQHLDSDLAPRHVLLVEEHVGETAGAKHTHVIEPGQHGRLGW